jgi:hypothetical protein
VMSCRSAPIGAIPSSANAAAHGNGVAASVKGVVHRAWLVIRAAVWSACRGPVRRSPSSPAGERDGEGIEPRVRRGWSGQPRCVGGARSRGGGACAASTRS